MAKARQQYFADETSIEKESREFAIEASVLEKINSIEPGAQVNVIETVKVNWTTLTPDENKAVDIDVPLVDDTLYSTSSEDALSARQGRILYDYIQNIQSRGRYLSNWNCVTWLATTNPVDNPYTYRTWDYYLVWVVAQLWWTNYRPDGSQYIINQASTTVETETVKVSDMYIYDGTNWVLLVNTEREIPIDSSLSSTSTNPVENRVITNALNWKQDTISDLSTIRSGASAWATALQPGASLSQLSWTSDNITEWSTNLFMTTQERTKLWNQSWVNTWDETKQTIEGKLLVASASNNWYLSSTDWSTFNWKQDAISDLTTIRSNASAWKSASDTIATYWDIVTHNVSEFATATQGWKADTAIQPWDNVSELTNDAWYITDAYHDNTKQDKLIAWANIQIAADWQTISATDTIYQASDFDIKDLTDSTWLRTTWNWKQDELIAWTNIQIAADGKTISATDTTYTAWPGISISNNNVISNTQTSAEWWNITWTLSNQTDLNSALSWKQNTLTAWTGIDITSDTISIDSTVAKASDLNTKTFYLSSTSDLTTAQTVYNWYAAGKNPIIVFNNVAFELTQTTSDSLTFYNTYTSSAIRGSYTQVDLPARVTINHSSWTVTRITQSSGGNIKALDTNTDYSTPYAPVYDWSPATKKYVDDRDTYIGTSAPTSNLVEWRLWYDTTNDVLKVYDGANWNATWNTYTAWTGINITNNAISVDSTIALKSDINTKTFYISSTSDLTNAQAAYDWYAAGKNAIVVYQDRAYILREYVGDDWSWEGYLSFGSLCEYDWSSQTAGTKTTFNIYYLYFILSFSGTTVTVSNISPSTDSASVLATDTDYTTPYTPQYAGSPATKQYVDNSVKTYTAWTWIGIDANNQVSNTLPWPTIAASAPTWTEWALWYDTTNDVLKTYNWTSWEKAWTQMKVLSYGSSTWQDFIDAYNENAIVYCRASSNSNPATWVQWRMAFMAFVNINSSTWVPTSVEFQYYRSRSDHNTQANQLDQVFVYTLTSASWWTWSVTERNTWAKAVAWTWINLAFGSGNMTISNTWVTSFNWDTWAITLTPWTYISLNNNVIDVDTSLIATKSDLANFAGFLVVAQLPTTDIKTNIIYLLWPVGTWADKYEEYIYSNNTWIKIWDTSIDLSPYFHKTNDDSDDIIEGSTHLFLTSAERTKLWNTSWTNSGDETKTTIQTKLWVASSSNSWYLTSTDWDTFNNKVEFNATNWWVKIFDMPSVNGSMDSIIQWFTAWGDIILREITSWVEYYYFISNWDWTNRTMNVKNITWTTITSKTISYTSAWICSNIITSTQAIWSNTKTFTISWASDLTTAAEIIDWIEDWNMAIILYNEDVYCYHRKSTSGYTSYDFFSVKDYEDSGWVVKKYIELQDFWGGSYYIYIDTYNEYQLPSWWGWIICDPNSPISVAKIWAWTEAQYQALSSYSSDTVYLTV